MRLTPVAQIVNQNRNYRLVMKRDDLDEALNDNTERPCTTRQATQEECLLYGIKPGAHKQDKPRPQYRKRWA
jgi:hypothetical protein